MRAGEIIGRAVVDEQGVAAGVCTDLRCWVRQGAADTGPQLTLAAMIVSPRHHGSLLGYERHRTKGPWLVAAAVRRLHEGAFMVRWEDVLEVPDARELPVRLRAGARRLPLTPSG